MSQQRIQTSQQPRKRGYPPADHQPPPAGRPFDLSKRCRFCLRWTGGRALCDALCEALAKE
jgi:hypothetical protein